jgi:hypothetical protein
MDKYQRTLTAISNYPLRINRYRVATVKLVLYTRQVVSLPSFPRHSLLHSPPSY